MLKYFFGLSLILLLLSSFSCLKRKSSPVSSTTNFQVDENLVGTMNKFYHFLEQTPWYENNCKALEEVNRSVYRILPTYFGGTDAMAKQVIDQFFKARIKIHSLFRELIKNKTFTSKDHLQKCSNIVRITMRNLRTHEDYYGIWHLRKEIEKVSPAKLKRQWPYLMVNEKLDKGGSIFNQLQTGDFLLSRVNIFTTAVISRIGAIDNQFSHLSIVYKGDGSLPGTENGKLYVVESVLQEGLRVVTLEKYLREAKSRIAIFRYRNVDDNLATPSAKIAADAARYLAKRALTEKVCYNFSMNMQDSECYFCSQAVAEGIRYSCNQGGNSCDQFGDYDHSELFNFPLVYSQLKTDKNPLIRMLSIKAKETFAPSDVEIDPRMELLAEWRNFKLVRDVRLYDMVMTKIFQWMESGHYSFRGSGAVLMASKWGDQIIKNLDQIPDDMPGGFLTGVALLFFLIEHTGPGENFADLVIEQNDINRLKKMATDLGLPNVSILEKDFEKILRRILRHTGFITHMRRLEKAYRDTTGNTLTEYQIDLAMEYLRTKDCQSDRNQLTVRFHDILNVPKGQTAGCNPEPFPWDQTW